MRKIHEIRESAPSGGRALIDEFKDNTSGPIKDIDPFTTMSLFNRNLTNANRRKIAGELAKFLGVKETVPDSFQGIPVMDHRCFRFFPHADTRGDDHIDLLWNIFADALDYKDGDSESNQTKFVKSFNAAINLPYVKQRLTIGLYWIRPCKFLSLDKPTRGFLEAQLGEDIPEPINAESYLELREKIKSKFGTTNMSVNTFPELTYKAVNDHIGVDQMTKILEKHLDLKNQVIFYGPPGTGKTYHARKFAEELVENNTRQRNGDEPTSKNKDKWFEYLKLTLEKSLPENYSINDFTDESKTNTRISLKSDDDEKRIAVSYTNKGKNSEQKSVEIGIHEGNMKWLSEVPKENRFVLVVNLSNSSYILLPHDILIKNAKFRGGEGWDKSGKTSMWFTLTSLAENDAVLYANNLTKKFDCKKFLYNLNTIFASDYEFVTFHPSYSYEEFMEGIRARITDSNLEYYVDDGIFKRICSVARKKRNKNCKHVIIIDEINRGNISKIFGELITIIEKDKREEITVALPYSKEKFTVPKNVYIVGTMNTADRSLTQIDVALRRRFSFVEFLPNYKLIDAEIEGINLADLLKNLNERLLGEGMREKQIGHAYFMKKEKPVRELNHIRHVFENEIIPLFQDYFYEDYEKIEKMIGPTFIDKKNMSINQDWKDKDDEFVKGLKEICKPPKQSR